MRRLPTTKRTGFTLIELIIVITILVVIASLTIGAIGKSFTWIRQKNTEQTMTKIIQRIQYRKMVTIAKEIDDWSMNSPVYQQAEFNINRDKVLKIKYLTKWSFPMTYAEAFHNVQESRLLYDPLGYPQAVAILNKLRRGASWIPNPFACPQANLLNNQDIITPMPNTGPNWAAGTIAANDVPSQNAACLLAIFETCLGTTSDELTNDELLINAGATSTDTNPRITDAWGTPMMFLRYGNLSPIFSMGMVAGGTPLVTIFGDAGNLTVPLNYVSGTTWTTQVSTRTLTVRAAKAFPEMHPRTGGATALPGKDSDDPEAVLVQGRFFNPEDTYYPFPNPAVPAVGWMNSPPCRWLTVPMTNMNGSFFNSTFGYALPDGFPNNAARNYSIYAPFVVISAGGDKQFTTWDDNLDSYRLKINTSGQQ